VCVSGLIAASNSLYIGIQLLDMVGCRGGTDCQGKEAVSTATQKHCESWSLVGPVFKPPDLYLVTTLIHDNITEITNITTPLSILQLRTTRGPLEPYPKNRVLRFYR
jgi:hypothetical protein